MSPVSLLMTIPSPPLRPTEPSRQLLEHHELSPSVRVDMENILYASLGMSAMVEDLLALFRLETHGLVFSSRPIQTRL